MKTDSQRPGGREGATSALNAAIHDTNLAENVSSIASAKAVFGSVTVLLTLIRVCFLLSYKDLLQVHTHLGLDGQKTGSRRTRVALH